MAALNIRRVRLDVDWAAGGPGIVAVTEAIAAVDGVEAVSVTVTEIDMETVGTDVIVEGTGIDIDDLVGSIDGSGAVVHSIDQLVAGDRLVEFVPRAR
jgi:hypothetical protein